MTDKPQDTIAMLGDGRIERISHPRKEMLAATVRQPVPNQAMKGFSVAQEIRKDEASKKE